MQAKAAAEKAAAEKAAAENAAAENAAFEKLLKDDVFQADWALQELLLTHAGAKHPGSHALGGVDHAPEGVDRLGYIIYAKALANTAREVESPHTSLCVGLYAQWGGGKSFLWTLISDVLQHFYNCRGSSSCCKYRYCWCNSCNYGTHVIASSHSTRI